MIEVYKKDIKNGFYIIPRNLSHFKIIRKKIYGENFITKGQVFYLPKGIYLIHDDFSTLHGGHLDVIRHVNYKYKTEYKAAWCLGSSFMDFDYLTRNLVIALQYIGDIHTKSTIGYFNCSLGRDIEDKPNYNTILTITW